MRALLFVLVVLCGIHAASAQRSFELLLYPDGAPQSNGLKGESVLSRENTFVHNITTPKMVVCLPDKAVATGQVVIICPGGGYGGIAIQHEGVDVAKWLNDRGVAAVVLWYRMPNGHYDIPLADLHRAIELTRTNASEWEIEPNRVGVMGFSAGGHLASTGCTQFTEATRPDFGILIYPVVTMKDGTHGGTKKNLIGENADIVLVERFSGELQVTPQTPVTFIALSDDDKTVPPINSTQYYNALKRAGVAAEMHIYPKGGHGWGFRESWKYGDELRTSLGRWLKELQ